MKEEIALIPEMRLYLELREQQPMRKPRKQDMKEQERGYLSF